MKTIILGTAHLESTPGKCSPDKKFYEYIYSRQICQEIKVQLQALGYKVYIDIEQDDMPVSTSKELIERCRIVNNLQVKHGNCIYISIHVNASAIDGKWHNATGWEIYTSPGKTEADKLATCIYDSAKANFKNTQKLRTDFSDGDPDKEAEFYVLKHTNCPAVLTENFFMDSKKDIDYLQSDLGYHQIVRTHVEGIIKYIQDSK